ncbi:Protein of unknown function [Rhodoblastus acidophilus]|uniref:DUF2478 domain-containing protein n=1 Tax=Rhodoblastus acidophilus TaxID=1074 RepID=A0A212QCE4_RHOAC|nr:DUF2478 domain-containing protein [Rhodoblastus acidophilus]PPQ40045.1 DUF2478 domain-containing protein [Rhodoblastus acidophilus]RAI22312.1 DUF2478 domain-containing protein [Rhodoblastus acidophilus]SNB57071.1 Protein of unknown function [Rhodoblastus acidophilus]
MTQPPQQEIPQLAAVVYDEGEPIDALFAQVRAILEARGQRVGGVVQTPCAETIYAIHIDSGRSFDLMQDLGACASGCRLDSGALAEAAGLLAQSLAARPDLLLVSRFGRAEAEGGGFLAEIGAAAAAGQPTLIGVARKRWDDWRAFAGDCAACLSCDAAAVLAWRDSLSAPA